MASDKPLVSVLIPVHYRCSELIELLNSLEAQLLASTKFEVILAPSPSDPCIEEVEAWKIKYSFNLSYVEPLAEEKYGQNVSRKRNQAAALAKSEILAFTDDDCIASKEWLSSAVELFQDPEISAVEGTTQIPKSEKVTLTYKGLQRLSRPRGYQTCNIFYRKEVYEKVGGFDEVGFPWFLEDTDLAWSVMDAGYSITSSEKAVVYHPNKEPAPWRLLHEARGTRFKTLLFKKHRRLFKQRKMKVMRLSYYVYLGLYVALMGTVVICPLAASYTVVAILSLLFVHMLKLFAGCSVSFSELTKTAYYSLVVPPVALVYTIKGAIKNRLSFKELLYLLSPK